VTARRGNLLVIDDDPAMCDVLVRDLSRRGFSVSGHTSSGAALDVVGTSDFDAVLTDMKMAGLDGLEVCRRVHGARPGLPVVMLTAFGSLDTAVAAIRAGAYDFVTKPVDVEILVMTLDRAVEHRRLVTQLRLLREGALRPDGFDELEGDSAAMRRVYGLLERIADSDVTVLVTGESGTGKELVGRALHRRGRRTDGPFVAVSCAALPEQLLESELFGHTRGAFTDARHARTGLLLAATGGTLFLDEVAEIPLAMQAKLLRVLQERRVRPLGAEQETPVDVRIVAATNRDLEREVAEGRFREDLFFRLNVVPIHLPPLRARGRDVLLLAQRLLERASQSVGRHVRSLSAEAAERLLAYPWPGNVRELQNCVEHAVALARSEVVALDDLPERVRLHRETAVLVAADHPSQLVTLAEMERRYVLRVLDAVGGQRADAARVLGIDRKTLYRKLQVWLGEKA
jgi:two-component system response regulator HydG